MKQDTGKRRDFVKPMLTVEELSEALYRTNRQLEHANAQLRRNQEDLKAVLTNISHDLRSPIAVIQNALEYLLTSDTLDKGETASILGTICSKADYMEQLVNDILLLFSQGPLEQTVHMEMIELSCLLEDYYQKHAAYYERINRNFILDIPHGAFCTVLGDRRMLLRLLDNLLSNALKYTAEGDTIRLSCSPERSADKVKISVEDTGAGIAPGHLERIFDQSYMGDESRTPGIRGYGLGLSIAKTIVSKHGGEIWCESRLNEGSVFYFTLPLLPSQIDRV